MTTEFVQIDTAAGATNVQCSGNSNNTGDTESNRAEYGGSASLNPRTITVDGSAADLNCVWMEIINVQEDGYDGGTGNWTVRISVTTGNHQITWDEVWICHVDSGYSAKATVGSATGLAQNIASTGTYSTTVNQGTALSLAAGDMIIVIFAFDNGNSMGQDFDYTPDVNITGPGNIVAERRVFISHA